jgi:cell division protein FtsI/penicillin-binding protein 2
MPKDYTQLVKATNEQNSLYNQAKKSLNLGGISAAQSFAKPLTKNKEIRKRNSDPYYKNNTKGNHVTEVMLGVVEYLEKLKSIPFLKFLIEGVFKFAALIFGIFFFWTVPFFVFLKAQAQYFAKWLGIQENTIKFIFGLLFVIMITNLFSLQVLGTGPFGVGNKGRPMSRVTNIIPAKKGNIYFKDLSQSRDDVPLTSNSLRYNAVFDPTNLKLNLAAIKQNLGLQSDQQTLSAISVYVASRTNISSQDILNSLTSGTNAVENNSDTKKQDNPWSLIFTSIFNQKKPEEKPPTPTKKLAYYSLKKEITQDQSSAIDKLREDELADKTYLFTTWLSQAEQITIRSYPEGRLLAQTIGYSPANPVNSTEANSRKNCRDMVQKNQDRETEIGEFGSYQIGSYGIEQRYCSELGGLNGRSLGNTDLTNPEAIKNQTVQNGANLYLTIDKNIQKKTEQVLEQAVTQNTNETGGPKDGCAMVMEAGTGKILAIASYPAFDPNNYADYFASNPKSVVNNCTGNDYEVGSVMKPLTVASSITNKQNGGDGVDINYSFVDYDEDGKEYKDADKKIYIQNAKNYSWKKFGYIGLKEVIRDSINTGIANIVEVTGNKVIKDFFLDKLEFGHYGDPDYNLPNFAGSINGDTQSFDADTYCEFCFTNKAFGQGFSISPLQLMRAYTALANDGNLVQPQWLEKIQCMDGSTETLTQRASCVSDESHLRDTELKPVFNKKATDATTGFMLAASEEGYLGNGPTKAMVEGYRIAIKSGTAQVSRPIVQQNGKILPCDATCNTKRGIYDHTLIGYNTGNSRYIVMIKLAEPNPGVIENFSSTTLPTFFSDIMKYTLEYMSVPKER